MADTTRFIDKSDFAPYYDISTFVEDIEINPHILFAQKAFVKPILTKTIYENLQTAVENSTETADDLALIAALTPFLVYKSFAEFMKVGIIRSTEMGYRIFKEEYSEPATDKQLEAFRRQADTASITYEKDLRNFLCENASTYSWEKCRATKQQFAPSISIIKKKYVHRR